MGTGQSVRQHVGRGRSVRDRLRVLLPSDPENYYRQIVLEVGRLAIPHMLNGEGRNDIADFIACIARSAILPPLTREARYWEARYWEARYWEARYWEARYWEARYPRASLPRKRGENFLNLIIEVTGEKKKDKESKVATVRQLWVPAVNNHGGVGRGEFIEIADPWDAQNLIRKSLSEPPA